LITDSACVHIARGGRFDNLETTRRRIPELAPHRQIEDPSEVTWQFDLRVVEHFHSLATEKT
jgi:hypothetical protein